MGLTYAAPSAFYAEISFVFQIKEGILSRPNKKAPLCFQNGAFV